MFFPCLVPETSCLTERVWFLVLLGGVLKPRPGCCRKLVCFWVSVLLGPWSSQETCGNMYSSVCPSIHPFSHPSIHAFICPFVRPSIHPCIHPSVHSSIHLFIHPQLLLCLFVSISVLILRVFILVFPFLIQYLRVLSSFSHSVHKSLLRQQEHWLPLSSVY